MDVGLGVQRPGYNIFVSGSAGTGKKSVIRRLLEVYAKSKESPCDWIYVYNFDNTDAPKALQLKAGEGQKFSLSMAKAVARIKDTIQKDFQNEEFENTVNEIVSNSKDKQSKIYLQLEKLAAKMGFSLKRTSLGIETIPLIKGKPATERAYEKLSKKEKKIIEDQRSKLEPEVLKKSRKIRDLDEFMKRKLHTLEEKVASRVVERYIDPLLVAYNKSDVSLLDHIEEVRNYILDNIADFSPLEVDEEGVEPFTSSNIRNKFNKFKINVFIDNKKNKDAPVVIETNPTYYNLFGKLERDVENGMYLTDFTKIKPGSIHKANGGYLVLDVNDVLKIPYVWETLKRVLKNRLAYIEELDEHFAAIPATALRPQPIPLDIKVILLGDEETYQFLLGADEEFLKIFKIKSDFDSQMNRNLENIRSYGDFVASRCKKEKLRHFDNGAVSALVEFASRVVEDQKKLTTEFGVIKDIIIEADYRSRKVGSNLVRRSHVEEALEEKHFRANLFERRLFDLVKTKELIISVDGKRIGLVNGLTVYDFGDYSFGKVCRVTCVVSMSGEEKVFNIERASKLSGNFHDKGVFILSGFLNALIARKESYHLSASLVFEQSYGEIDGDSATLAELTALVSSLAEIPVFQNLAITGSLNQLGDVQPIGGVNEKIEGFYKTCKLLGRGDTYNVIIPHQNVGHLMLNKETRKAVTQGFLRIFPVKQFWEVFEIATGVEFGAKNVQTKVFSKNSALGIVLKKLEAIRKKEDDRTNLKR